MAGPWLYVISARSRAEFDLHGGSIPVTIDNYWKLVENRRLLEDRYWGGKHDWESLPQSRNICMRRVSFPKTSTAFPSCSA